jgi:hypothetical protein
MYYILFPSSTFCHDNIWKFINNRKASARGNEVATVRFEVLTAVIMKMTVFWVVSLSSGRVVWQKFTDVPDD